MNVLVIDSSSPMAQAVLRPLNMAGYVFTTIPTVRAALALIDRTEFDCILIDILNAGNGDKMGVAEIQQFSRNSAVALVTSTPLEWLVEEALADRSIELQSASDLIMHIDRLPKPALLAGPGFHPRLIQEFRDQGLRVSRASTLQFALNLLTDGWHQIVLLEADIDGLGDLSRVAIFHQVKVRQLAILASAVVDNLSGITFSRKPATAAQFITLLERTAENRLSPCGLA
jgi:hypothetical protein